MYKLAPDNLPCKFGIATAVGTLTPAVWYCPAAALTSGSLRGTGLEVWGLGPDSARRLLARQPKPNWEFAKLNTEYEPEPAARFNIRSIPTLIVSREGHASEQRGGCRYDDTLATIRRGLSTQRVRTRRGGGYHLFRSR
jgi:Thioredoxin